MRILTRITLIFLLFISGYSRVYTQNVFAETDIEANYQQAKTWYNEALSLVDSDPKAGLLLVNKAIHSLDNYTWGGSSDEMLRLKVDLCNLGGILHKELNTHKLAIGYFRKAVNMSALLQYEQGFLTSTAQLAQIRDETDRKGKMKLEGLASWGKKMENSFNQFLDKKPIEKSFQELERVAISQIAILEEKKKEYDKALGYQEKLFEMYKEDGDSLKMEETRYKIAHLLHLKGDHKEGLYYAYSESELPDSNTIYVITDNLSSKSTVEVQTSETSASSSTIIASREERTSARVNTRAVPSSPTPPTTPRLRNPSNLEEQKRYEQLLNHIKFLEGMKNEDSLRLADKLDQQMWKLKLLASEKEKQAAEMQKERTRMMAGVALLVLILLFFIGALIMRSRSHKKLAKAYNELDFAHRKLKMAQTKLVESEKLASLGQLTAGIAHEINNPVNFISGNIGPLQRDLKDIYTVLQAYDQTIQQHKLQDKFEDVDELKEDLEINFLTEEINSLIAGINEGATRTSQIVKGLRTFARMDEEVKKPFDIHQGIDSTLTLLNHQCKQVEITKEYSNLPDVEAFPGKINQVFMNLLTNAIQAMDGKGKIRIRTELVNDIGNVQSLLSSSSGSADQYVKISIKDSGQGIPEKIRQRIFEPFFTTKDVGEGTGLGLPICKGIVEDHNGKIEILSQEGMGTEVVVSLPLNHQEAGTVSA